MPARDLSAEPILILIQVYFWTSQLLLQSAQMSLRESVKESKQQGEDGFVHNLLQARDPLMGTSFHPSVFLRWRLRMGSILTETEVLCSLWLGQSRFLSVETWIKPARTQKPQSG